MERAPLRQTEVTIAGMRSPIIEGGPSTAEEAVVFVHGSPGSSRDWKELAAQVSIFGRAVALDMPGFGRAQKPEHFDYTVDGYARHLTSALTELRIRRVHLVLHDFGGPWGWPGRPLIRMRLPVLCSSTPAPGSTTTGTSTPGCGRRRYWEKCP